MDAKNVAELPPNPTIIRTDMGSQWGDVIDLERHKFVARDFAALTQQVAKVGLAGVAVFGEVSALQTLHEINYLAVEYFANHPEASWEGFVGEMLAPLLGGAEMARNYIRLLDKEVRVTADVDLVESMGKRDREGSRHRWQWLLGSLQQRHPIE